MARRSAEGARVHPAATSSMLACTAVQFRFRTSTNEARVFESIDSRHACQERIASSVPG